MNDRLKLSRRQDTLPTVALAMALAAAAMWYLTGGAVWYRDTAIGLWPALLLLPLWPLVRLTRASHATVPVMEASLGLFLLSALTSVWVAYDRTVAVAKLGLVVGAAGLAIALARQVTRAQIYLALAVLGLASAGLTLYMLMSTDWTGQEAKIPALALVGRLASGWLPSLAVHQITPNVAGGMLATLLPLTVALIAIQPEPWLGRRLPGQGKGVRLLWAALALLAMLGLVLSASRGAWLGTAVAAVLWVMWRQLARLSRSGEEGFRNRLIGMGLVIVAGLLAAIISGYVVLAFDLPGAGGLANRLQLFRQGLSFARDYAYTGVGLGLFSIPFSVYTLLIHVGYIVYSHNMYVDILAEQGFLGLTALVMVWAGAGSRFAATRRYASEGLGLVMEACMAAMAVIAVHGVVDNVLYGSRGILLLFVPVGVLSAAASRALCERGLSSHRGEAASSAPAHTPWQGVALALMLCAGGLLLWLTGGRPVTAWYANLGAVAQTQAELQRYDPLRFHELTMDEARLQVDLARAEALLHRAAQQPGHPTAPRRLAAIEMARGCYPRALAVISATWSEGNRDDTTRLLYGDALVAVGQPAAAARVITGVPWARDRLAGQAWARYWQNEHYAQAAFAYEALALLAADPAEALQQAEEARRKDGLSVREDTP